MQLSITSAATPTAHADNKTSRDGVKGGLESIRTVQWAEVTIGNIAPTLRKICTVTSHPNSEVRVQFATFAMDLLTQCPTALRGLASNLLDVMVRYTYDTYPGVSDLARAHVKTLSRMMTADYTRRRPTKPPPRKVNDNTTDSQHTDKHVRTTEIGHNLGLAPAFNLSLAIVEQRLHDLIMSIPRHIRTMDDSNKLEGIRLVRGYVSLLGVKCRTYFGNELHLSMLMRMLMQLLTFDDSSMTVWLAGDGSAAHTIPSGAPEAANDNTENFGRLPPPLPKRFKYFRDEKVAKCIRALCRELGSSVSLQIVCEKLIPALQDEESSQSRQACLILTEMMQTPSDDNGWGTSPEGSAALLLSVLVERLGMQTFKTDRDTHAHTPTDTYTDTHGYTQGLGGGRTSSALLFDEDSPDINRTYSATLDLATSRGSNHVSSERKVLVCLLLEALAVWVQVYGSCDTHGEADGISQSHTPSQLSTEDPHTEDAHTHTDYRAGPILTTLERDEAHARAHDMFVMTVLYPLLECLASGVPLISASAVYVMKAIQYYSPEQTRLRLQSQTVPSPPSTHMPKPTDNTPHTHRHVDLYVQSSTIAATTMKYTEQPVDQWDSRIKREGVDPLNAEVTLSGSGNLNVLIRSQIDVVIDTVSHHLLYPELYPQAASVLRVILDNSTCDVLPILSDVLAEMVDRVAYNAPYIRMYLPVFAAVVSNVHTWLSTDDLVPATRKWDQDPEEEEPPMKPYQAVTKSIMDVLQHFMSDEDDVTRIQVCTTIAGCFSIIRHAENELYPMVHLFWPPLLLRLRDRNPRVRMAALDCVCAIIETSTWFAKTRVVDDLLPILQKDLGLGQGSGTGVLGAITGTLTDGHSSLRIDNTRERAQACNHAHESSELTSCRHNLPPPECSRHTCGPNSQKPNSGSKIATSDVADVCDACVFALDSQGKPTLSPTLRLLRADSGAVFLPRGSSKVSSVYGDLWFQLLRCVVCIAEHIPLEDVETPNGAGRDVGKEPERTKHVTSGPMEELPSSQRRNTSGKDTLQTQGGAVKNGMNSIVTDTEAVVEGPMAELDELIGNMLVNDSHADFGGGSDEADDNVNANEAALGQHDKEARIVDVICSLLLPCMHELAPEKVYTSAREGYHQLQRKVPQSLDRFLKRSLTYYELLKKDEAKPDMNTVDMVDAVDREKTTV
ncbi:hypothetical protein SARC_07248 [Sphaeroforma arctica JP610]|uniref:Uncharacterized protein n=1 Tax=Sphaeroforma arctica JP610 TaxID=667725 RepID=A0A0L0FV00_9EUKA|nr:hypothetical protein SARC_07248 [Sphaeroforma arctica JP610]KNC80391.1 hypothetical protein SARC_07248 [Sphaeroforma arctica JP610]|eukprot:XP_014154293.1 hypothetical protein SARC_07248 [Sphaeroforma arctica JP610]